MALITRDDSNSTATNDTHTYIYIHNNTRTNGQSGIVSLTHAKIHTVADPSNQKTLLKTPNYVSGANYEIQSRNIRALVEDARQRDVQTALPKAGGAVRPMLTLSHTLFTHNSTRTPVASDMFQVIVCQGEQRGQVSHTLRACCAMC